MYGKLEFVDDVHAPLEWADGTPLGPMIPADTYGSCQTPNCISTSYVSTTANHFSDKSLALANPHVQTQLLYRHNRITEEQYRSLTTHYFITAARAGSETENLSDCFNTYGNPCDVIRCREHGHREALNRWRVAGCIATTHPHRYSLMYPLADSDYQFDPCAFYAAAEDNIAALCDSGRGRQAAALLTIERDPSGYVHAQGILWSSHEVQETFDETVSVRKLKRSESVPFALYLAKDLADPVTRPGALALNGGRSPRQIGKFWGPGGYRAAKQAWPYQRGQKLVFKD